MHPQLGEHVKNNIVTWSGNLVTSSLSVWLLYVLTKLENIASILEEIGVELASLSASILGRAERLGEPRDFEDHIHASTMLELGISRIISNDKDFDGLVGIERIF